MDDVAGDTIDSDDVEEALEMLRMRLLALDTDSEVPGEFRLSKAYVLVEGPVIEVSILSRAAVCMAGLCKIE